MAKRKAKRVKPRVAQQESEAVESVEIREQGSKVKQRTGAKKKSGVKRKRADEPQAAVSLSPSLSAAEQRRNDGTGNASSWAVLEAWLRTGGAEFDAVEVREDPASGGGLGAFARRALGAGEVVFRLPTKLILTDELALQDPVLSRVQEVLRRWVDASWAEEYMPPLMICLKLCRALAHADDPFHVYASSLPPAAPGIAAWPLAFRDFLATTSLGPTLVAADAELDHWCRLLKRVAKAEPALLSPTGAFDRSRLEWARGMLQSRHFPGAFSGVGSEQLMCMVPLLDILNHQNSADVSVRVRSGSIEFVCDSAVGVGAQIWTNYGSKTNGELLACYGFAINDNKGDTVKIGLAPGDGSSDAAKKHATSEIHLTAEGVPQDVIDSIEEEQNTTQFVALLRAVTLQRRHCKECLARLPQALNFTVCKGPLNRARKRYVEAFLEGQLQILEASLECMQRSEEDEDAEHLAVGAAAGNEELADDAEEETQEEEVASFSKRGRRKKRRT
eukprot:TRINITY_DN66296_c0_g1_i1.p1 TRINITY_DN66296_c0_g1~~TRINITY_DN66296_c0_g1_i1.p1  ORF type:complete len:503 (-),score=100.92 TRINITY_DN66296_c0_g1_i1:51-1559(-)